MRKPALPVRWQSALVGLAAVGIASLSLVAGSIPATATTTAPAPATRGPALTSVTLNGDPRVYYTSSDGHVQELGSYSSARHSTDVTAASGGAVTAHG